MDSLKGMYYIDYILYIYIYYIIDKNRNTEGLEYISLPTYFTSLVNNLKVKIEPLFNPSVSERVLVEEELILKYILFLIHNNILPNYLTEDINRKFYKIFDHLSKLAQEYIEIKRIILWSYTILLENSTEKEKDWSRYLTMDNKECNEEISRKMEVAKIDDKLVNEIEREEYFRQLKQKVFKETERVFKELNIPLILEEIEAVEEEVKIKDKILWRGGFVESNEEVDLMEKKEKIKKKYSVGVSELLDLDIKGTEIKWNESTNELENEESGRTDKLMKRTRKKKKTWLSTETEILIRMIRKYGTNWNVVHAACDFRDTTREQIIDKYKSLVKTNRMQRIRKR